MLFRYKRLWHVEPAVKLHHTLRFSMETPGIPLVAFVQAFPPSALNCAYVYSPMLCLLLCLASTPHKVICADSAQVLHILVHAVRPVDCRGPHARDCAFPPGR